MRVGWVIAYQEDDCDIEHESYRCVEKECEETEVVDLGHGDLM